MRLKRLILCMVLGIILGLGGFVQAETTVTQVTHNAYEDKFPQICGNYVVWQGYGDGDWEIFLYNMTTGQTLQVTDNSYDDTCPTTDGTYVVWQGYKDGEWDVFLWDGSKTQTISSRDAEDGSPQIAGGLVVWTSQPFGDDFVSPDEIIAYDVGSGTHLMLSEFVDPGNAFDDSSPRINDDVIIWVQTDEEDNAKLFVYDRTTGTVTEDPDHVWQSTSQRDGNLNVLTRRDGIDTEIFLYDTGSGKYHQVTDNGIDDTHPSISGNHMAWMGGKGKAREIYIGTYKYLALTRPPDKAVLSKTRSQAFTWEAITYDKFKIHFSNDPRFPTEETLTFPAGEDTWLSETSFTPTGSERSSIGMVLDTHGYWSVEGEDEDGDSAFTETRSLTIQEDAGTGGGGGCLIDTAIHSLGWWRSEF